MHIWSPQSVEPLRLDEYGPMNNTPTFMSLSALETEPGSGLSRATMYEICTELEKVATTACFLFKDSTQEESESSASRSPGSGRHGWTGEVGKGEGDVDYNT